MGRLKVLATLLYFISISVANSIALQQQLQGKSVVEPRIINGTNASPGEFPYIVALRSSDINRFFCGGSIINKNWVLTAAHCMDPNKYNSKRPGSFIVAVGTTFVGNGIPHEVSAIFQHPQYARFKKSTGLVVQHDIALVKVQTPFSWSQRVQPIRIGRVGLTELALAAGFGFYRENSTRYGHLKETLIATCDCSNRRDQFIYGKFKNPAVYDGDSGGPLVNSHRELVGIISGGGKTLEGDYLQMFTRVETYVSWISLTTRLQASKFSNV